MARLTVKFTLLVLLISNIVMAQPPAPVKSPEVQSDGRVSFRLRAPNAKAAVVNTDAAPKPLPMQKDADGVWSVTSDVLAPDFYSYTFTVDGVRMLDPSNPSIVSNLLNPSNRLHVPSTTPQPWDRTGVPHGVIHQHFYHSGVVGDDRSVFVYTPPGYDPAAAATYPVLYLLHGFSDDASAWSTVGFANLILDNLIAQGKAKPMIVVMPLGYGALEVLQPQGNAAGSDARRKNIPLFTTSLLTEVLPLVEKTYHVQADPCLARDCRTFHGRSRIPLDRPESPGRI